MRQCASISWVVRRSTSTIIPAVWFDALTTPPPTDGHTLTHSHLPLRALPVTSKRAVSDVHVVILLSRSSKAIRSSRSRETDRRQASLPFISLNRILGSRVSSSSINRLRPNKGRSFTVDVMLTVLPHEAYPNIWEAFFSNRLKAAAAQSSPADCIGQLYHGSSRCKKVSHIWILIMLHSRHRHVAY